MRCSGQAAHRIEETFVTAEQLVEAVESDKELTDYDGIGPKTAEIIEDWWENRFEREENMDSSSVERTSSKSATIHFHSSWSDALGERYTDTGMERSER
jgi:Holliday junction resolvasome RuvABC DNA-binding subunit